MKTGRVPLILAAILILSSGLALGFTLRAETTSGILISPGFIFVMPDSPASLSFASNTTISNFSIGASDVNLEGFGVFVTEVPSGAPSVPMVVTIFSPTASSGDAFAWISTIPNGSSVIFSFTGLTSGVSYLVGADNTTQGTFSGPNVGFTWSAGGIHFFELAISNPQTLDTTALTFLLFLVAIAILTIMGLGYHPAFLLFDGIVTLFFAFWTYTQIASIPIAASFILLGIGFMAIGMVIHPRNQHRTH